MKNDSRPQRRGRPRLFDRDAMLQQAMLLFWKSGYEGTSVAQLVETMGITPPSLYAAFGSKENLYREAVELYLKGPGSFVARALAEEPSALAAVQRILRDAAKTFTAKSHPAGCVVSTGALNCSPEHQAIADNIGHIREASIDASAQRLKQAKKDGELTNDVDVQALARFYGAVVQGMAIQARDGATKADLLRIADIALRAWPTKNLGSE